MSDANFKEELRARLVDSFCVRNENVFILRHHKGLVYLMGTHHNQERYASAVAHLIVQIRPHTVAVELCRTNLERYNVNVPDLRVTPLSFQPPRCTYMDFVPDRLKDKAIGEELLLGLVGEALRYEKFCNKRDHIKNSILRKQTTSQFKVKPKIFHSNVEIGREMTVPFGDLTWRIDQKRPMYLVNPMSPYKIMLADQPVEETFCKIASALSEEEKKMIQKYQANFLRLFVTFSGDRTIMLKLLDRNEKLRKAILYNRDMHMAKALMKAVEEVKTKSPTTKARVVGVVGKSHVPGIIECWQKISTNRKPPANRKTTVNEKPTSNRKTTVNAKTTFNRKIRINEKMTTKRKITAQKKFKK